jgi:acetyltransferase-like isoleucine patch superfamily enzyme
MSVRTKLAYRLYLATMRYEPMFWLKVRRFLLGVMTGRKLVCVNIFPDVFIDGCERLSLGQHVSLNRGCHVSAGGGVRIGSKVSIGHGCTILSSEHSQEGIIQDAPVVLKQTEIGNNCWLGARVIILAGVKLPEGTIVGAGSVVTCSVEQPYSTIAGVPARVIKTRPT